MMSDILVKYDRGVNFFFQINPKVCSYITVQIFTLICIISSTVGGKLQNKKKKKQARVRGKSRWEAAPRIAQTCRLGHWRAQPQLQGHGPSAPLKRGSVWLVCHYRLADVKGSVTCLVKRKEFEGRAERERGLLCKQLH